MGSYVSFVQYVGKLLLLRLFWEIRLVDACTMHNAAKPTGDRRGLVGDRPPQNKQSHRRI